MRQLASWIAHYKEVHPHKALGYRSPHEFIATHDLERVRSFGGYNNHPVQSRGWGSPRRQTPYGCLHLPCDCRKGSESFN